ncbi:kinase-like domain-containing protein [Rhizophagus irregularis DAOM 181602=DAOM 197198]|nr:kinase-like domain-containing protein [Rhizophagus irregularis DAOM 181602=DAOM 197198]
MSDNMSVIVRKRGKRINHEPFCYDFCKKCEKRKVIDKNHETCQLCYKIFKPNLSGNIVIDEIIRNTRVNFVKGSNHRILEFVPYNQFKNIEFIAEGGFSKIYKAIWVDGPINTFYYDTDNIVRENSRSQTIDPFYYYQKNADKRKFEDDSVEDSNDNEQSIKRRKFLENENSDYFTKEIELDINMSSNQSHDKGYVTKEIELDINAL